MPKESPPAAPSFEGRGCGGPSRHRWVVVAQVDRAAALGKLGGEARARNMTPEQRAEQAKKAAAERWKKPLA